MALVPETHPNAQFLVEVWKRHHSAFTTRAEAETEYNRLRDGKQFDTGAVSEWVGGDEQYKTLAEFSIYEDEL